MTTQQIQQVSNASDALEADMQLSSPHSSRSSFLWIEKHPWRAIALVGLLAILLGLTCIWVYPPSMVQGGTNNWWPIALNVAHGHGYVSCQPMYFPFCEVASQATASREPLPILLFAATASLTGDSLLGAVLVQLILFIATLIGTFCLARRLTNNATAVLAALGWSLYLPAYRLVPQVSGDMLATFFVVWAIYFTVRGQKTDRLVDWGVAGMLFGAGALSRSVVLYIAAAIVLGLISWQSLIRHPHIRLLKQSAIVVVAAAFVLAPWVVRNYVTFGHPIVGTTLAGYNLYRHNSVILDHDFFRYANPHDAENAVKRLLIHHPELQGTENEYEMDGVYNQEAQTIILSHPDRYVMLSLYRFLPLWFDVGIDEAYDQPTGLLEKAIITQQLLLLIVGSLGFWLLGRKNWVLWLPIVAATLLHMAVAARLRFINLIIPLLIISFAFAVLHMWRWVQSRNELGHRYRRSFPTNL